MRKLLILSLLLTVGLPTIATDNSKPKHQLVVTLYNSNVSKVKDMINEKYRIGYKVIQLEMDSFTPYEGGIAKREVIIIFESK